MSSQNKLPFFIAGIILLIAGGIFAYYIGKPPRKDTPYIQTTAQPVVTLTQTSIQNATDAQLDKDAESIDNSLSALEVQTENIDKGLNDSPITIP